MATDGDTPKSHWFGYVFTEYDLIQKAVEKGSDPNYPDNARVMVDWLIDQADLKRKADMQYFEDKSGVPCVILALATNASRYENGLVPRQKPKPEVYAKLAEMLGKEPKWYLLDNY